MLSCSLKINQWIQNNFILILFWEANLAVLLDVFWLKYPRKEIMTVSQGREMEADVREPGNGHEDSNTQNNCRCLIYMKFGP